MRHSCFLRVTHYMSSFQEALSTTYAIFIYLFAHFHEEGGQKYRPQLHCYFWRVWGNSQQNFLEKPVSEPKKGNRTSVWWIYFLLRLIEVLISKHSPVTEHIWSFNSFVTKVKWFYATTKHAINNPFQTYFKIHNLANIAKNLKKKEN